MTHCVYHRRPRSHKQGRFQCSWDPRNPPDTSSHSAFLMSPADTCIVLSLCHMGRRCNYKDGRSLFQTFLRDSLDHNSPRDDQEGTFVGTPQSHDDTTLLAGRCTSSHSRLHKYLGYIRLCRCCPGNRVYRHRYHDDGDTPECSAGGTDTPQSSQVRKST